MTDVQYNIVSSVFFIPYILFEVPSNSILQKYFRERPSWWIGGLCVTWGITMTLHGVVQSYGGLIAARIALGIAEAGFFPGFVLRIHYDPDIQLNSQCCLDLLKLVPPNNVANSNCSLLHRFRSCGSSLGLARLCHRQNERSRRLRGVALDLHHR